MPIAYSGKPVDREFILTHGIGNLRVPFDMGTFRKLKERADGGRRTTYCVDVVFAPLIVQLFMDDEFCSAMKQFRPWVTNLALKRVEESIGVTLSQQSVKLVKPQRYKDGEEGGDSVARDFKELPDDKGSLDADEIFVKPPAKQKECEEVEPLIQDVTPAGRRKPAIKKGFLNNSQTEPLYGPEGSKEGVLPENAGDPMGWMPKKLRQQSKIVDCASPEWQEHQKKQKQADESNSMRKEFSDILQNDVAKWSKRQDKWGEDLPEGTEEPKACKYDVDYARFNDIPDVEEEAPQAVADRDWYFDSKGERHQLKKTQAAAPEKSAHEQEVEPSPAVKKGFFENAKAALYPNGSEQAKAPPDEAQMFKELSNLMGPGGDGAVPRQATEKSSVTVKAPERKAPDFTLTESGDGLQLAIAVPQLTSMQGVNLDVTERRASLDFPSSAGLRPLQVELPRAVLPTAARAKFSKKTHQIMVTLPAAAA